jgi:hypothetical protein
MRKGTEHNIQFAADSNLPAARWIADIEKLHSEKKEISSQQSKP